MLAVILALPDEALLYAETVLLVLHVCGDGLSRIGSIDRNFGHPTLVNCCGRCRVRMYRSRETVEHTEWQREKGICAVKICGASDTVKPISSVKDKRGV
jgi:hypothetical protein